MSLLKFINLLSNDNKMSLSKIYQGELIHERKRYYDHYERIYKDCEIFQCENINYQYEVDKSNDMIKSEVFVDGENRVDENVRRSKVAKIRITESIVEIIKYISDKLDLIILPTSNTFDYIVYDKNDFFKPHRDHIKVQSNYSRSYVLIIYLNTVKSGGETRVETDRGIEMIPAIKNTFCLFQSHLVHEGMKVKKGQKIIFKTDVMIYEKTNLFSLNDPSDLTAPVSLEKGFNSVSLERGFNFVSLEQYLKHLQNPENKIFLSTVFKFVFGHGIQSCNIRNHYDENGDDQKSEKKYVKNMEKYQDLSDEEDDYYQEEYVVNSDEEYSERKRRSDKEDSEENGEENSEEKTDYCVKCIIAKQLKKEYEKRESNDYYGLRLLKLCLGEHFDQLVKGVSINGRFIEKFKHMKNLHNITANFNSDLNMYYLADSGIYQTTGYVTNAYEASNKGGINHVISKLYRPFVENVEINNKLPDNYQSILIEFEKLLRQKILDDQSNEAVRLSHSQDSACNELEYFSFSIGLVFHCIYIE